MGQPFRPNPLGPTVWHPLTLGHSIKVGLTIYAQRTYLVKDIYEKKITNKRMGCK